MGAALARRLLSSVFRLGLLAAAATAPLATAAMASPWAEVGDDQLRSDIQILANAGVIDDITTQWPIPWAGLLSALRDQVTLAEQPSYVRAAARRVTEFAKTQMRRDTFSGQV